MVRPSSLVVEETQHPHQCYPPFLLKYVQEFLKQEENCLVNLLDCYVRPISFARLLEMSADVVVVFFTSLNAELALRYSRAIKEKNNSVIVIGVGPDITFNVQNYFNSPLDFILPGECEKEIFALIRDFEKEDLQSVRHKYDYRYSKKMPPLSDINELPIPRYTKNELLDYQFLYPIKTNKQLVWGHLLANRGCSHVCIFCSQNTRESFSRQVRIRDVTSAIGEIRALLESGANFISFADDDFTISYNFVHSLCSQIKGESLDIQWTAQVRIDEVDFSLLKLMKEAGCSLLAFGIESGSERIIKVLNKNDRNIDWLQKAKEVFADCRKLGIATVALFIIGSPTEKQEDLQKSIELAKELRPDIIQVHFFTLYPGSLAYRQYQDKIKVNPSRLYHYAKPKVNLSEIETRQLEKAQFLFYRQILLKPDFIVNHLFAYASFYFHNRDVLWVLLKRTLRLILCKNR